MIILHGGSDCGSQGNEHVPLIGRRKLSSPNFQKQVINWPPSNLVHLSLNFPSFFDSSKSMPTEN